jgi:hypothetical protein
VEELKARKNSLVVQPLTTSVLQDCSVSPSTLFMTINSQEIAQQLTVIEYNLFSKIQPSELINQAWNGQAARRRAPHVLDLIQRTNRLSFWIASLLLWQPTLSARFKMLTKIVSVGVALKELNNYNTLMGIVAGLSMSCVNRLRATFGQLDRKPQEMLEKLQTILNPGSSFKNYRQELHNAKHPVLPYL